MESMLQNNQVSPDGALNEDMRTPVAKAQIFKQASVIFRSETPSTLEEDQSYLDELKQMSQRGRIELVMGPMFAGKSTELLRRVKRLEISGKKCLSIKYAADTRYASDSIATHDQIVRSAISCRKLSQITYEDWMLFDVIGIDEGQFFEDVVEFCETAANNGKIVILSALNGTYEKKGWNNILELIPLCEKVKKLSAICKVCSQNANYTFRTCHDSSQELIGGADMYMPLCRECYNHKHRQQMLKMNEIASAGQKDTMLSSSGNSTTFNESTDGDKNNSFEHDQNQVSQNNEKLIDMNILRQLEKSNSSAKDDGSRFTLHKVAESPSGLGKVPSMVTPIRGKRFNEDMENSMDVAGQKPHGERTEMKLQTSGNKILSYQTKLDDMDDDEVELRIKRKQQL